MKYHTGKYVPRNIEKYVGDPNGVVYRSSWEKKAMIFFDNNPGILKWQSEEVVIPYISPLDNKQHRYFPDFTVMYVTRNGETKRAIVEVKPLKETMVPVTVGKKKTKRLITEVSTYVVNQAKWEAARMWCSRNGFDFMILTERELFNQ